METNFDFRKSVLITTIGAACATLPVLLIAAISVIFDELSLLADMGRFCHVMQTMGCIAFIAGLYFMSKHLNAPENSKGIKAMMIAVGLATIYHFILFSDNLSRNMMSFIGDDIEIMLVLWGVTHALLWWGCKQLDNYSYLPLGKTSKAYIYVGAIPIVAYIALRIADKILESMVDDLNFWESYEAYIGIMETYQTIMEVIIFVTLFGLLISTCIALYGWYRTYQHSDDNPEDNQDDEDDSTTNIDPIQAQIIAKQKFRDENLKIVEVKSLDELKNIITHPEFYAPEYIELAKEVCFNREKTMAALATKTDAELQEIINKPVIYTPSHIAAARDELKRRGK